MGAAARTDLNFKTKGATDFIRTVYFRLMAVKNIADRPARQAVTGLKRQQGTVRPVDEIRQPLMKFTPSHGAYVGKKDESDVNRLPVAQFCAKRLLMNMQTLLCPVETYVRAGNPGLAPVTVSGTSLMISGGVFLSSVRRRRSSSCAADGGFTLERRRNHPRFRFLSTRAATCCAAPGASTCAGGMGTGDVHDE